MNEWESFCFNLIPVKDLWDIIGKYIDPSEQYVGHDLGFPWKTTLTFPLYHERFLKLPYDEDQKKYIHPTPTVGFCVYCHCTILVPIEIQQRFKSMSNRFNEYSSSRTAFICYHDFCDNKKNNINIRFYHGYPGNIIGEDCTKPRDFFIASFNNAFDLSQHTLNALPHYPKRGQLVKPYIPLTIRRKRRKQ